MRVVGTGRQRGAARRTLPAPAFDICLHAGGRFERCVTGNASGA
jgi:hypothetical protein